MTKLILMVAASVGCATLTSLSASAQTNSFIALNTASTENSLTTPSPKTDDDKLVHFCGENLPTNHPAIAQRWTRTLIRQASLASSLALLKRRASVVFPLIEPILKQYRIPSDFKFLPLLESAVTNRAVSRKGAAGFWQLMPQTAQSLGLSVSHKHDERFNLKKATHAACRYLNDLYNQLGSWMLVATAYNAGPNYIQQLARRHPDVHPMALPYRAAETKAYLFQAVAIKELLTRPKIYRDRFSGNHFAALSDADEPMLSAERASILASFDLKEGSVPVNTDIESDKSTPVFVTDSTTSVVLLTDDELVEDSISNEDSLAAVATANGPQTIKNQVSSPETTASVAQLLTRSVSEGPVVEGQLCVFQVVQPTTIAERTFSAGDLIHAHIEIIDAASGRVFLRTDRLITAQTQETIAIKLVATEQPRQPGVTRPARLEGWRLAWEQL